ncbi:hypothetical protein GCM10011410_14870 [Hoyosella rhizosphaerae]|uniref:Uncharacterized protein n=1 Tax=Hoyosella rhizosphaerae TaxID=1755582 RepID=A0A916U8W2_9ACTN|nr:hypothetical protein GCM10011410_14870 [Hoyosella rhizosphaerae]
MGAVSGVTSIAAHGAVAATPHLPFAAVILVSIACAGFGATVAAVPALSRTYAPMVGTLVVGQIVGHGAMVVGMGGHATFPALPMLAAHIIAAVLLASVILTADHAYSVVTSALRVATCALVRAANSEPPILVITPYRLWATDRVLITAVGTRAPPFAV